MRCYFNLSNGDRYFQDEDGIEVSSLHHAHVEALQAIREVYRLQEGADFDWDGWALSIVDPAGRVLLSLELEDVIAEDLHVGSRRHGSRLALLQ